MQNECRLFLLRLLELRILNVRKDTHSHPWYGGSVGVGVGVCLCPGDGSVWHNYQWLSCQSCMSIDADCSIKNNKNKYRLFIGCNLDMCSSNGFN